jgi:hypothetical protein
MMYHGDFLTICVNPAGGDVKPNNSMLSATKDRLLAPAESDESMIRPCSATRRFQHDSLIQSALFRPHCIDQSVYRTMMIGFHTMLQLRSSGQ